MRDDIQTSPIEVHIQSSNGAETEQFYFLHPNDETEREEQIWERKQRARKNALGNDTKAMPGEESNNNETKNENETIVFQTEITRRTEGEKNDNEARDMTHRQDHDNVLRNYKLRLLMEPYDEQMMATNPKALQYIAKNSAKLFLRKDCCTASATEKLEKLKTCKCSSQNT